MQTIRITTSQNIDIDYEVASVADRILGYMIDGGLFLCLYLGLIFFAFAVIRNSSIGIVPLIVGVAILYVFYDLVSEIFMNGQSIGKKIMKTRVISLDGGRPTVSQFARRWILRIVDFSLTSGLGALILVIVSEKNQRIGDIAAGTVVVKTTRRLATSHLAFSAEASHTPVFPETKRLNDADIQLINEVLQNVYKSQNTVLLYQMANKIKAHLGISAPEGMGDYPFLQAILKDYNYFVKMGDDQEAK